MSHSNHIPSKTWHNFFRWGQLSIFIAGFLLIRETPVRFQFIPALISALAWFITSFLISRIVSKRNKSTLFPAMAFAVGISELILAISFSTLFQANPDHAGTAVGFNIIYGALGFASAYAAIMLYWTSKTISNFPSSPFFEPNDEIPDEVKALTENGRAKILGATINTIYFFTGVEVAIFVTLFLLKPSFIQNSAYFIGLLILNALCGLIIISIRKNWEARKWRERALESGIPKETLEKAAKLGGIPWPKTKSE